MTLNQAILNQVTLNAPAAAVTIPIASGYTDLRVCISARDASTAQYANDLQININGSSANVSHKIFYGNGAGVGSGNTTVWFGGVPGASSTANTFSNVELYISDYSNSSAPKVFSSDTVTENNSTNAMTILGTGRYNSNTAITELTFNLYGGTSFTAGSSFTVYGITKLGVTPTQTPKATGGDIIKNDGTYWYHAFLSTGAFIPQQSLSCEVFQVAGGGGSANDVAGGGGAGGVTYAPTIAALSNTIYAIAIGAGGAGATNPGGSGGNSTSFGITALGGGGASAYNTTAPSGGSGGGGSHRYSAGGSATQTSGANYTGYGNAGGAAVNSGSTQGGGGGGGAIGAGGTSTGNPGAGGNGGAPITTFSAWASATGTGVSGAYAGGGGGASQYSSGGTASGGGTAGTTSGNANPATANTGGGAGGGRDNGANGGSGIVIVRYAMA